MFAEFRLSKGCFKKRAQFGRIFCPAGDVIGDVAVESASNINAGGGHRWFPSWNGGYINIAFGTNGIIDFFDDLMGGTVFGTVSEKKSKS